MLFVPLALLAILVVSGNAARPPRGPFSVSPAQCANRENGPSNPINDCSGAAWINGNLNSSKSLYREGDFVPFRTEIAGLTASRSYTIQIGYDRETPVLVMKKDTISHDTVPGFYERFENAYIAQLQDFVQNLTLGRQPPITVDDGIAAQKIALAATKSAQENRVVDV